MKKTWGFSMWQHRALFFLSAFLVSPAPGQSPKVTFVEKPGQAYEVHLSDGRAATLVLDRKPVLDVPLGIQITDNTCTDAIGAKGAYQVHIRIDRLSLEWTTHPDPKKIGQIVSIKLPGLDGTSPFTDVSIISAGDRQTKPKLSADLPQDQIEFADYSWLPQSGRDAPASLPLARWDTESMEINPETGLMENRTVSVLLDVLLKRSSAKGMVIAEYNQTVGNPLGIFRGDVWDWVLPGQDGYCLISLKSALSDAATQVQQYLAQPPKYQPYLFGTDEYSSVAFPATLSSFKQNPDQFELE